MKNLRRALFKGVVSLILCFSMLLGTTYAWFTDSVTSSNNIIKSGKLDLKVYWTDDITDDDSWRDAEDTNAGAIFDYDRWEPGYTCARYIKIVNNGSLAFKYFMNIIPDGEMGNLADVIDVYYIDNYNVDASGKLTSIGSMTKAGTLADVVAKRVSSKGELLPKSAENGGEVIVAIAMHMQESAGNEYQGASIGTSFSIEFLATQLANEEDSFGSDYDKDADYTVFEGDFMFSQNVETENNIVKTESSASSENGEITTTVKPGTKVKEGVTKLEVAVSALEETSSNLVAGENELLIPVDVHVEGVAEDNTVPLIVALGEALPKGLNIGNYTLYHVEKGVNVAMTAVSSAAELDVHNEFYYDPATGNVTVAMATFSEVTMVANTENKWTGTRDYTWYDADATELTIANADQLAGFGAIVGGMAKDASGNFLITYEDSDGDVHHNDTFADKTVTLLADINLGDKESENDPNLIFYPIGYWNSEETYEKDPNATEGVSSGFYTFQGTFDGNGNTISNFYQNTWEMKGDHDWYDAKLQYFRDGMGLFGRVYGGTIKNLTVDNFSCDSEIGTTGVIAAYADSKDGQPAVFENITITNCNPRVYNIGNGGIVGCAGWYSRNDSLGNADYTNAVTFRNITVDQTNKISALWGSWGVSCAGILGQYYPNSSCGIKLENCHVAAIIDVNNDVCSNYQYYWYRYAGMFIGTIRANKDVDGYTIADTTGVFAKDCTYTMGNWNEYWYCEIVANSLASYTHDHQFSRLDNIYDLSEISDDNGETWKKEGHFALLDENRDIDDCYHIFKDSEGNLYRHFHDVADESNPNIYEDFDLNGDGELNDLKEDRQRYFIPFNQLMTGLDMGIRAFYDQADFERFGIDNLEFTLVEDGPVKSEEKFKALDSLPTYKPDQTIKLGDIVEAIVDETKIAKATLYATVSPAVDNDNTNVSATYSLDTGNWAESTITFGKDCSGAVKIVINDYFYCTPTVIVLNEKGMAEKFTANSVSDRSAYTQIALGTLFGVKDGETLGNVTATVTDPKGNKTTVSGTSSDWATKTIDLTKDGTWTVVIKDDDAYCATTIVTFTVNEIDKFAAKGDVGFEHILENDEITKTLGDVFNSLNDSAINSSNVTVQITNNGATCTYTKNESDWKLSALKFVGTGSVTITITDGNACNTAEAIVTISNPTEKDVFAKKFTNTNFTYRVGNANAIKLSSLFSATNLPAGATVSVSIANTSGNATGAYTPNATWSNGEIKFSGTGVVTVTIDSNAFTKAVALELEVVDAVNTTVAASATANNVVLLNDCGFGSLEVSGGYTLYGNGFTMTCGSDSTALDTGYSFVTLNNGTLDNVQIVCPNFDYAVLYKSNMTEAGNRSETTDKTRYYNVKSGVMVSGNSQILNSRISGARAAVNVTGGNLLIDNSRIEGGAVASLLIGSANSVTLRDVTLVQKPTASTYDSSKKLMGFSVLFICDAEGNTAPVTLEGTLVQNAWVNENYKQYVPSAGQSIISTVLGKTDYLHDIDGDGKNESLNLGFAYMPESATAKVNATTITDNRSEKSVIPYDYAEVSILSGKTYVYSYKNTNGTVDSFKTESQYVPNKQGDIITVTYSDTADGLEHSKSFGTGGWVYELNVDLDKASGYKLDFSKLSMSVNGVSVTDFRVNGNAKPASPVAVTAGGTTYTLTTTINGKTYTATYKVTGTETSKESPSKISGPTTAGFGVAKSYGGDWSGAADVLTGVKVKYWSVAENKYVEFDFSNFTVPGNAGKLNDTNSYWEYTHTNNDFTLKVTNTVAIHSGKSVYGMPIRGTDGKLYFTISSTTGYVGSSTTSRAITMQYEFTDNNGGDKLTFTHTFSISYDKEDQYSYSDLSGSGKLTKLEGSSGGGSTGCVTPDTLITLADGTQVRVDSLTGSEELLVWNMETGMLDKAPIMFVDSDPASEVEVVTLTFSDGTEVEVIYEHGFWDYDLNRYVYLDVNAADYIGHTFAKKDGENFAKVQLVDVVIETEVTMAWSPVTCEHLCYFVNGMLSMPGGVGGLFNIFDVDPETMTYDYEAIERDIATYGLYTYEELNALCPLSREMFEAAGGAYLKISIGKGNMTEAELFAMIARYNKFFD